MKVFKKSFSKFTKHKKDDPASSQSAEPSHIVDPHVSQSTTPSHSHNQHSDKALSRIISIVEVADNIVEDISVPGLKSAVKVLLNALKKIKVRSQCMYFKSYIMRQLCNRQPGIIGRHSSNSETMSTSCKKAF